ncbi:hypothetical protein [Roseospira visakhapatnamensis]|uniref:Uncharacterized protein n=1 Tax=Roseospira visakhapatnamensis TaxID=390880 RepID=A0A7W6RAM2_9PROT|nr:hypothetical protein [Roseospira visakhapatnamensis]MBB4264616.1 hypothetical protein [Roseospira visakhapatnamensis]
MEPRPAHIIAMLELHHGRMVARLRNVLDTQVRRAPEAGVITNELGFLALEAEAYRAFVHAHADQLARVAPVTDAGSGGEDEHVLRDAADSLYFDILHINDRVDRDGESDPGVVTRIARVGADFLEYTRRCHLSIQRRRADRVSAIRAVIARGTVPLAASYVPWTGCS